MGIVQGKKATSSSRRSAAPAVKAVAHGGRRVFVELKKAGYGAMMRQVDAGLPVSIVDDAVDYLHISKGELIDILSFKPSSLSTWSRKPQALLPQQESDRIARVARVTGVVERMIGGHAAAIEWLNTPVPALGSRKPISLLGSDAGARLVEDTLFRSLAGVYA
jgi:putative toxin-antitoxin system antitoxin component (TIGR02293 family)